MQTETGAAKKLLKYILFLSALIIIPISFENLSTALLAALTVLLMMFVGRVPLKQIGKLLGVFCSVNCICTCIGYGCRYRQRR